MILFQPIPENPFDSGDIGIPFVCLWRHHPVTDLDQCGGKIRAPVEDLLGRSLLFGGDKRCLFQLLEWYVLLMGSQEKGSIESLILKRLKVLMILR